MSDLPAAAFAVGDVVHHRIFDYRGVIIDVDPVFSAPDEWYEIMARSRPPKDRPWYHVLVHAAARRTYVAERHLELDTSGEQIAHPELGKFFDRFTHGRYARPRAGH